MLVDLLKQFLHLNGYQNPDGRSIAANAMKQKPNEPIQSNSQPVPNTMTPRVPPPMMEGRFQGDLRGQRPMGAQMGVNDDITQRDKYVDPSTIPAPVSPIQQRVNEIESKDYGRYVDPQTGQVTVGKDRDKKWSTKDKIGSALLGILSGAAGGPIGMLAGGLNAGMDRNYLEKRQDRKDLQDLVPKLKYQQDQEKYQQEQKQRDLQNQYYAVRPDVLQQNADTNALKVKSQAEQNQRNYELKVKTQDWKEADRREYYQLEQQKQAALQSQNDRLYELSVRRQQEIENQNDIKNKQAATNESGRNARNVNSVAGAMNRAQIQADISARGRDKVVADAVKGFMVAYQKANEDRMPPQDAINKFLEDNGLRESPLGKSKSLLRKSH